MEEQVIRRTQELGNLLAISSDLNAIADAPSLMLSLLRRLRAAVPFDNGSVWITEGEVLHCIATSPSEGDTSISTTLTVSTLKEILGWPEQRRPILMPAPEVGHPLRSMLDAPAASALLVPLPRRDSLAGVLVLADPVLNEAHQVDLVAAVAQQFGAALDNARLLLEARERSALEERQHLARELHDSVSQALFGVVLGLQTAQKEVESPGRLRDAVEYASELADAALKEMRSLIFELSPEALEADGLVGLLGRQAEMLRARHGLEVELDLTEPPLPLETKAVLYRVAQEAVHNIVKHARAKQVDVTLAQHDGLVQLVVRDNGRGFTIGTQGKESFGLHSMHERMLLLGGHLKVRSELGAGTQVLAALPLPHRVAATGSRTS